MKSYLPSYFDSLKLLYRLRSDPELINKVQYNQIPFYFRGIDEGALREVWEENEYGFLARKVSRNGCSIVDLGAHIGCFGARMFALNPAIKIQSYEANIETYPILDRNSRGYTQRGMVWDVHHGAVTDVTGKNVYMENYASSMSSRISSNGRLLSKSIALRDILTAPVDILKIDIEGSEQSVLETGHQSLIFAKNLVIEIHPELVDKDIIYNILKKYYKEIKSVGGRKSSKPLLWCSGLLSGLKI